MASINHLLIATLSISIYITKSQLVVCNGADGGACFCPPSSDPTVSPGDTCILDCGRADMCVEHTLTCRAGDPCIVNCGAKSACADNTRINANSATDVTVICSFEDACKTDIYIECGVGDCSLECIGFGSCLEFGIIITRQAKSWTCIGNNCPWGLIPLPYSPSPTSAPTPAPTSFPTKSPTPAPTFAPSRVPTDIPTNSPTLAPTSSPTQNPTYSTANPSSSPTKNPTKSPTEDPTNDPTSDPTKDPTKDPTSDPTNNPTNDPTEDPTGDPTTDPTSYPTVRPSIDPTSDPTDFPTSNPTFSPTNNPTIPTISPSYDPTIDPTNDPTYKPTENPTEVTLSPSQAPTATEPQAAVTAEFLQSTGWTVVISVLTISVFILICCVIIILFVKKYRKDTKETKIMNAITTPNGMNLQKNISPETNDTDQAVIDGLETTGKVMSISDFDLNILHTMNRMNKEQSLNKNGGTMGKLDGEFQIDADLVSAFMFGGATNDHETNFGDFGEFGDNNNNDGGQNGGYVDGNDDDYGDDVNMLQKADSTDVGHNVLQQRMKLMRLLQQQYELMNDYNINPNVAMNGYGFN